MATSALRFRPSDVVLFRDSRPFRAGAQSLARSQRPEPGTLFGAARAAGLEPICQDLRRYGAGKRCATCSDAPTCPATQLAGQPGSPGHADHEGAVTGLGGFVADSDRQLFVPSPALLTSRKDNGQQRLALRVPEPFNGRSNADVDQFALPTRLGPPGRAPNWVRLADLRPLLRGDLSPLALPDWAYEQDDPRRALFASEPRVGLARSAEGVALPRYLYRADFRRYTEEVSFALAVEHPDDTDWAPAVFLGGRGRVASVDTTPLDWPPWPAPAAAPGRYAVTITGPAYFRAGWRPSLPEDASVASAVVPPLEPSQGWDLAAQRPRSMRWVCPAGSVWWIDATTDAAAAEIVNWHGRCLCEDRPAAGYGTAFVERWEDEHGHS